MPDQVQAYLTDKTKRLAKESRTQLATSCYYWRCNKPASQPASTATCWYQQSLQRPDEGGMEQVDARYTMCFVLNKRIYKRIYSTGEDAACDNSKSDSANELAECVDHIGWK